jgi:hypothetical protein
VATGIGCLYTVYPILHHKSCTQSTVSVNSIWVQTARAFELPSHANIFLLSKFYFILFYFTLLYFTLLYFIYFILFYFIYCYSCSLHCL